MNKSFIKKAVSVLLLASMAVSSSGCSKILEKFAAKEAEAVLTEALDAFYSDPVNGLSEYDDSFDIPDMIEESLAFAIEGVSASTYELGEPSFNSNRTTAKIPVTFNGVLEVEDIAMGTEDEVSDALGNCDRNDVEITFVLKNKKGDWIIEDMSELIDVFFTPYESIVFVDENGMPTSYYQPFFDECLVDSVWYEPIMSNPLDGSSLHAPSALLAVFYFDRPMYMTFTVNLLKSGDVVDTIEVVVDGGTYTTNGLGSPSIYSTADITVSNATLVSNLSEAVCIEGMNSIKLTDCDMTANNTQMNGNATFLDSIMIYQSMSGDADSGTSTFDMENGSLTSKNGHVFHVTNTNAVINLSSVKIINEDSDNILLSVCDFDYSK